ncbi:hypothetical protein C8P64_2058 [Christiangramia gaetbulicola]|uniref:Uncharacterized protein n=1 Tax=Christiangramia gaetbulicola TaxID=703340 RepID=A0A2T6AI87_9FLAO|nr:hypothetical protein [Christiangramia gaetbulicola]PTX43530.1 hypothetical protein C8P64_2058 [Christiangramia gaetbulicola]
MIDLIKRLLIEFFEEIQIEKWPAKERELVSRFAFSKLVKNTNKESEFYDPAQIGLEVRVEQIKGENRKEFVCKDLIIWKEPNSNAWTEFNVPKVIMEWKHNNSQPSKYDIDWLKEYTKLNGECFGIAINIDTNKKLKLTATLIHKGEIKEENWLLLNAT